MRPLALALALALAACSGDDHRPAPEDRPPPMSFLDAAPAPAPTPVPPPAFEPFVDAGPATSPDHPATHDRRVLALMLVSTPSGATAAVDGKVVGVTPTYWEGDFTGRTREFTFVLPGYTMARYKFVPIQNGFVHGRLEHVGDGDAGVPEIPMPQAQSVTGSPSE